MKPTEERLYPGEDYKELFTVDVDENKCTCNVVGIKNDGTLLYIKERLANNSSAYWVDRELYIIDKEEFSHYQEEARKNGRLPRTRLYIASSWRNQYYPETVERLRAAGFDVYDFRNPPTGHGFKWSMVDENYMDWTPSEYRKQLKGSPLAKQQFRNDIEAMESCDACVLVLPCGRSAHTEAGWFAGRGKKVVAYLPEKVEPELMYALFTDVCDSIDGVIDALKEE